MEEPELKGYTVEEFEAMMRMIGTHGIYKAAVTNGWVKPPLFLTPEQRMNLVNQYRANKDIPAYFFDNGDMGKFGDLRRRHGKE